jgi:quercetin dioxygenase-like cupin family protein
MSQRWKIIAALFCVFLLGSGEAPAQARGHRAANRVPRVRVALSHNMPRLNGESLKVTIVEVTYGPGESSPPHSHPCPVIGYVLEGSLRTKVKGEPEALYKAGETFYEAPGGVHEVSANASKTKPVRFTAYFLCDHETPLSVAPDKR